MIRGSLTNTWSVRGLPRTGRALVLAALLAPGGQAAIGGADDGPAADATPQELLAWAVDRPAQAARAAAATELGKRTQIDLDAWRTAMEAFGPLDSDVEAGRRTLRVELFNEAAQASEATELALSVPAGYDASAPAPLIVALHGAGGSGASMVSSWSSCAAELGALVLAPTDPGPNAGFSGEPRERGSVLAALRWMRRRFNVDENRVWLVGYSRGGHLAWDLAARRPGLFAGVSPQAGGPRIGSRTLYNNLRLAPNLIGERLHLVVGDRDDERLLFNVQLAQKALMRDRAGAGVRIEVVEGAGHVFDPFAGRDWPAWLAASVRDPWRKRVVLAAVLPEEASNRWLRIQAFTEEVVEDYQPVIQTRGRPITDQRRLKELVLESTLGKTARVEAEYQGPGRFRVEAFGAQRIVLLAQREQLNALSGGRWKPVTVKANGRSIKTKAEPSKAVLLTTFVERFDRTFLPEVAIDLPVSSKRRR